MDCRVSICIILQGISKWSLHISRAMFSVKVVMSSNEHHIICYDADKTKHNLNIFNMKNGNLVTTFSLKYPAFKEVIKLVALPDKPSVVAVIDVDKGNLIDIVQKKFIKSIPCWDGTCSKVSSLDSVKVMLTNFSLSGWKVRPLCSCYRRHGDVGS